MSARPPCTRTWASRFEFAPRALLSSASTACGTIPALCPPKRVRKTPWTVPSHRRTVGGFVPEEESAGFFFPAGFRTRARQRPTDPLPVPQRTPGPPAQLRPRPRTEFRLTHQSNAVFWPAFPPSRSIPPPGLVAPPASLWRRGVALPGRILTYLPFAPPYSVPVGPSHRPPGLSPPPLKGPTGSQPGEPWPVRPALCPNQSTISPGRAPAGPVFSQIRVAFESPGTSPGPLAPIFPLRALLPARNRPI